MKLTFSASVEVFDKEKYMVAVKEAIRQCFLKAGQKFLLAAVPRVPIWSGMARGAFFNAEDLFGKVSGSAVRTGRGAGKRNTFGKRGYYYNGIERTPQAGRQFSTPAAQILDGAGASLASGRTAFYFKYDINIIYFTKFDVEKWGALKAGGAAFEEYVRANLVLPDPLKFMTRKTYTVK